jgi:C1A family cysteine protease
MLAKRSISLTLIMSLILMIMVSSILSVSAENQIESKTNVLREYGLGAEIEDISSDCVIDYYDDKRDLPAVRDAQSLPQSIDLSLDNAFPCVRSQSYIGSCISWAAVYYQFGYQVAAMNGWDSKNNTSLQFSPKFVYNIVNNGIDVGSNYYDNYFVLKTRGAVRYSEFEPLTQSPPYEYRSWCTNKDYLKNALQYKIKKETQRQFTSSTNPVQISSVNSPVLTEMKELLCTGHVLTFTTDYGSYYSDPDGVYYFPGGNQSNSDWIYDTLSNGDRVCIMGRNIEAVRKGHGLSIVGYDDTIWYDYDGDEEVDDYELGAFKIVNSHDTNYGNDGFIWVMYDALNAQSNYTPNNTLDRIPIIESNMYHTIEVEESKLDLTLELTTTQTKRNQHRMSLNIIDPLNISHSQLMQYHAGGAFSYDGSITSLSQSTTFVFDYNQLVSGDRKRQDYQVSVIDSANGDPTGITNLKIIDRTGKEVISKVLNDSVDDDTITYSYRLGMMGDIDDSGLIDNYDATKVQQYLAGIETLSNEDLLVGDVDGDNYVSIIDAVWIQRKVLGMISEFSNGAFVDLSGS